LRAMVLLSLALRSGGLLRGVVKRSSSLGARPANAEKGREYIGLAKAVSRKPRHEDPIGAFSGLPSKELYVVLGIETSCDDTACAVVRSDGMVLGESIASQHSIHAAYGGIVPNLAMQAHQEAIHRVVEEALDCAGLKTSDIDAIACTVGPGLEICLRVGANKAREMAEELKLPFVRVHHLEAHCLVSRLGFQADGPEFPFVALLVSGGHCQLLWCEALGKFEVIGGTLDDALGEAYDKAARMLGIAAPTGGGPALERLALEGDASKFALPIPLQKKKNNCDFSYAGLKNALRVQTQNARLDLCLAESEPLPRSTAADLAASFQAVAIRHLEDRLKVAFNQTRPAFGASADAPTLAVVGGVAANKELRRRIGALCDAEGWRLAVPEPRLCTDNGVMVAWAAIEKLNAGQSHDPGEEMVLARWPFREHEASTAH